MRRPTIITLLLVVVSTWFSTLVLVVLARGMIPEMVTFYEDFGAQVPPFSQLFVPFWLAWSAWVVPALASIALVLVEIFVQSERSRFVVQIAYAAAWLVFVTLSFVALLLPCWKMLGPVGG